MVASPPSFSAARKTPLQNFMLKADKVSASPPLSSSWAPHPPRPFGLQCPDLPLKLTYHLTRPTP